MPEVETVRRGLDERLLGSRISSISITGHRSVRRQPVDEFVLEATGQEVVGTRRLGKFLMVDLEASTMLIHLRMSGQLLWRPVGWDGDLRPHTHARITFDSQDSLHFVDPRTFGELWLTSSDTPELAHIGPDALTDRDQWQLHERLALRRGPIKPLLMNQVFLAGIGNIYADEILWRARIRSDEPANNLTRSAIERLEQATADVMTEAVRLRGSTLRDRQYVDLMGESGSAQEMHCAYDREDLPCFRCGTPIKRQVLANRSAYFCPNCQRRIRKSRVTRR